MPGRRRSRNARGRQPHTKMPERPEERQQDDHQQHGHDLALDARREPQPGDEADHDARQRGHDLDRRLDPGLDRRVHELRGVERAHHRERDREEQRVERALDRAEDQRHQAELRLEVVGAAGGLPDVLGLAVALVPDLAEERAQRELGVRGADLVARERGRPLCSTMMPSIFGVSRTAVDRLRRSPGSAITDRSEVMCRSTSEPSSPAVTKLLSRVEAPIAAIGDALPGVAVGLRRSAGRCRPPSAAPGTSPRGCPGVAHDQRDVAERRTRAP